MGGRYFEEFEVGQKFVHEVRRTVTDMDNILFSALTHNPAAIHLDVEYAVLARPGAVEAISDESLDLKWYGYDRVGDVADDSVQRLLARTRALLGV